MISTRRLRQENCHKFQVSPGYRVRNNLRGKEENQLEIKHPGGRELEAAGATE